MRRLIFEAEHETFRASARRFFQTEVAPHGERWRQVGQVDREAYLKAGEQGFLLMWAGEEYGGAGVEDFRFEQVLIEENIRFGDPGFFMSLHSRLVGPYLGTLGTAEQKRRFLPSCVSGASILAIAMTAPGAGSDLAGMKTRAVLQGDHWVLDGSKTYISNGQLADLVVVAARTSEARHGIGLFIIERGMPGFERGRHLKKIGLHGQDTSELFFHGVKVPAGNVLGDPGRGFHALTHFLAEERLLGAVTYIAGRLDASLAAEAKLVASELEFRAADECLQLFGGAGYMEEYRIARLFTDARISRIYAGSSEVMKEIIARGFGLDDRKLV
ncbi:MAG: acyl-CoA dehydrogenase family protein [Steroidobacteraceae bacterium]